MKSSLLLLLRLLGVVALLLPAACRGNKNDPAGGINNDIYEDLPPIDDFEDLEDGELPDRSDFATMTAIDSSALPPVYFGYDSSTVTPGEMSKIRAVVDDLNSNLGRAVILQGHTDERGSREYNLALGERRALAVRDLLMSMGIGSERIQTLSYGEEQAAVEGFDESAWSQNRRVEFQLMQ